MTFLNSNWRFYSGGAMIHYKLKTRHILTLIWVDFFFKGQCLVF